MYAKQVARKEGQAFFNDQGEKASGRGAEVALQGHMRKAGLEKDVVFSS